MSTTSSNDFPSVDETIRRYKQATEPQLPPKTCQMLKGAIETAADKGKRGIVLEINGDTIYLTKKHESIPLEGNAEDIFTALMLKGYCLESYHGNSHLVMWKVHEY